MNFEPKDHLIESTKASIIKAAKTLSKNPEQFQAYYDLAFADEKKYSARAARVLAYLSEIDYDVIKPYTEEIAWKMLDMPHDSALMSILKIFTMVPLPEKNEELLGRIANFCFELMQSGTERAALRVYSMEILYRISNIEPIIKQELAMVITQLNEYGSPGFQSWVRKTLKRLEKEMDDLPESFFDNYDNYDFE